MQPSCVSCPSASNGQCEWASSAIWLLVFYKVLTSPRCHERLWTQLVFLLPLWTGWMGLCNLCAQWTCLSLLFSAPQEFFLTSENYNTWFYHLPCVTQWYSNCNSALLCLTSQNMTALLKINNKIEQETDYFIAGPGTETVKSGECGNNMQIYD